MIAFTKRKRGLHDEIANCLVLIKKHPAPGDDLVKEASRRGRRTRRKWIWIGVSVIVASMGVIVWNSLNTFGRPERALDRIELPAGSKVTDTERFGNFICLDSCPALSRTYSVIGDTKEVNAQVAAVLRRAGYKGYEIYPDPASEAGRRRCEEYGLSCKDETPTVFRKRFQIDWGLGEADELGTVKVELTIQYADG